LGEPTLSRSCVESIDHQSCGADAGQNLFGAEIWTRTVEAFGSDSGMSCRDVVLLDTPHQGVSPPEIVCSNGVCAEHRPCQILCSEVPAARAIVEELDGVPCPSLWSACETSCTQTLVSATKKSDGRCYESSQKLRECHIGECGKEDPCRVPYLVHAILGFRGATLKLWTSNVSEKLARSVVGSVARAGQMESAPFSIGDINLLMISPWQEQTQAIDGTTRDIGVKVVLQISFYNSKVKIMKQTEEENANKEGGDNDGQWWLSKFSKDQAEIQRRFGRPKAKSTCAESDLSPLASNALAVQEAIQKGEFIPCLIGEMKQAEGGDQNFGESPFASLYDKNDLIAQSKTISAWTIRTEVEDRTTREKSILERSPLATYALSGRTLWLTMTGVGLLLLFIADRCMGRNDTSEDVTNSIDGVSVRSLRSSKSRKSNSVNYIEDSESVVLLRQLFPNGGGENASFFSDGNSSISSNKLLGEHFINPSQGSRGSVTLGIELASRAPSRKSGSSRTGSRRKKY
jgi:hypothetical protein